MGRDGMGMGSGRGQGRLEIWIGAEFGAEFDSALYDLYMINELIVITICSLTRYMYLQCIYLCT